MTKFAPHESSKFLGGKLTFDGRVVAHRVVAFPHRNLNPKTHPGTKIVLLKVCTKISTRLDHFHSNRVGMLRNDYTLIKLTAHLCRHCRYQSPERNILDPGLDLVLFGSEGDPPATGHLWRDKWTALSGPLSLAAEGSRTF